MSEFDQILMPIFSENQNIKNLNIKIQTQEEYIKKYGLKIKKNSLNKEYQLKYDVSQLSYLLDKQNQVIIKDLNRLEDIIKRRQEIFMLILEFQKYDKHNIKNFIKKYNDLCSILIETPSPIKEYIKVDFSDQIYEKVTNNLKHLISIYILFQKKIEISKEMKDFKFIYFLPFTKKKLLTQKINLIDDEITDKIKKFKHAEIISYKKDANEVFFTDLNLELLILFNHIIAILYFQNNLNVQKAQALKREIESFLISEETKFYSKEKQLDTSYNHSILIMKFIFLFAVPCFFIYMYPIIIIILVVIGLVIAGCNG
jgi:hypothetical protein